MLQIWQYHVLLYKKPTCIFMYSVTRAKNMLQKTDNALELSGSIFVPYFLHPHFVAPYFSSQMTWLFIFWAFHNCNLTWLTKCILPTLVLYNLVVYPVTHLLSILEGTAAWTASITQAAKYHLRRWSTHRAGWKLLLPTLLPHERGGGRPGGMLLLLTEQELLFADFVKTINERSRRQVLDLSPIYSNWSETLSLSVNTRKMNLLMESLCYSLLKTFVADERLQANQFPGYLHQMRCILSEKSLYIWD